MDFYESLTDRATPVRLRQGDILSPVPWVGFSCGGAFVLSDDGRTFELTSLLDGATVLAGRRLLAEVESGIGIVLNQSCDLDGPGPIVVARVLACNKRISGFNEHNANDVLGKIKMLANPGRSPNVFYLPEWNGSSFTLGRSVADLLEVEAYPPSDVQLLRNVLRLGLAQPALQAFQERLAYCFGRFGAPDHLYYDAAEWQRILEKEQSKAQKP